MVRFSILIGIPVEEIETGCSDRIEKAESEARSLDARMVRIDVFLKAMNRFTYGLRGVYYSIAVSFWFFSAYAFIAASIILTIILITFHDIKTPRVEETPI